MRGVQRLATTPLHCAESRECEDLVRALPAGRGGIEKPGPLLSWRAIVSVWTGAAPGRCAVARSVAARREELHDMLRRRGWDRSATAGVFRADRQEASRRSMEWTCGTNVMPKPSRGVDTLDVLCASMPPVQLVKFLIVRAARRSAVGDVRKVSVDGHWRSQLVRASDVGCVCRSSRRNSLRWAPSSR